MYFITLTMMVLMKIGTDHYRFKVLNILLYFSNKRLGQYTYKEQLGMILEKCKM